MARLRRRYSGGLLYADRVVDLDPLSFWVHQTAEELNPELARFVIADAWEALRRVRPFLDHGCLILAPILTLEEGEDAEFDAGLDVFEIFTRDALRTAARTGASLADWPWLRARYAIEEQLTQHMGSAVDLKVADALAAVELPILTEISMEAFVEIREDESAFAEWRSELRMVARLLQTKATDSGFATDAQQLFRDALEPRAEVVRRATSRSAVLRSAIREQPVKTTIGALTTGGASALAGLPAEASMMSAGAGGVAALLAAVVLRPRLSASAAVLARLL